MTVLRAGVWLLKTRKLKKNVSFLNVVNLQWRSCAVFSYVISEKKIGNTKTVK